MPLISRVLVVGGGIGGLTAGIALRQNGIQVDLIEITPSLSVYGVGIIQPNNTLRALDKIGVAEACIREGASFPGWQIFNNDGAMLMQSASPTSAAPAYPGVNGITRPIFHRLLTEAAVAHGVNMRMSTSVADIEQSDDDVSVTFSNGRSRDYDLVLACDGIDSSMRHRIFGDVVKPVFTGQGVWRYNLPRPASMEWGGVYFGSASKTGLVPLSPSLMYMFVVTAEPGNPRYEGADLAVTLRERLAGYGGLIKELVPLINDPASVVYRPMYNVMLPKPWHAGRVVVMGDAAHATTPHLAQGAAMAIEDAVLLAEIMGRETGGVHAGLAEFTARRFDRAKYVVDASNQLAAWELEAWSGIANPNADPGRLLHDSAEKLMETY